jgi:hypothetical protein
LDRLFRDGPGALLRVAPGFIPPCLRHLGVRESAAPAAKLMNADDHRHLNWSGYSLRRNTRLGEIRIKIKIKIKIRSRRRSACSGGL